MTQFDKELNLGLKPYQLESIYKLRELYIGRSNFAIYYNKPKDENRNETILGFIKSISLYPMSRLPSLHYMSWPSITEDEIFYNKRYDNIAIITEDDWWRNNISSDWNDDVTIEIYNTINNLDKDLLYDCVIMIDKYAYYIPPNVRFVLYVVNNRFVLPVNVDEIIDNFSLDLVTIRPPSH